MATAKTTDAVKQLTYLAGALKAPRILDVAGRLADQARDAGWSFEDYLAAVLEREVSARNASGADLRIRAAGFGTRKTLEDFDFDAQPAVRNQIAALASGGFLTEARNVVLLGPAPARPTWRSPSVSPPADTVTAHPVRHRHRLGHPALRRPPRRPAPRRADQAAALRPDHHRRGRLPTLRARRREPVLPARLQQVRTRVPGADQQPAVLRVGWRVRGPGRRRRDDRPHRAPRRRPHPEGSQLPAPEPRHRHPAQH